MTKCQKPRWKCSTQKQQQKTSSTIKIPTEAQSTSGSHLICYQWKLCHQPSIPSVTIGRNFSHTKHHPTNSTKLIFIQFIEVYMYGKPFFFRYQRLHLLNIHGRKMFSSKTVSPHVLSGALPVLGVRTIIIIVIWPKWRWEWNKSACFIMPTIVVHLCLAIIIWLVDG